MLLMKMHSRITCLAPDIRQIGMRTSRKKEVICSTEEAIRYLNRKHAQYLKEAGTIQTDARYIREAAGTIGMFLVRAFAINSMEETEEVYMPSYVLLKSTRRI